MTERLYEANQSLGEACLFHIAAYDALVTYGIDYRKLDGYENLLDASVCGDISTSEFYRLIAVKLDAAQAALRVEFIAPTTSDVGTA